MIFKRLAFGEFNAALFSAVMRLTALHNGLAKIDARIARYGRPMALGSAEAMVPRQLFAAILALNSQVPTPPVPA